MSSTDFFPSTTIVVTDSGLGGLSVAADLENQLRVKNNSGKFKIVFFNSLAASDFGYNSMHSMAKKSEVFDSALNSIEKLYNPDIILIACNTLSVVYDHTQFSKNTKIKVLGIIDLGIEMIMENIQKNPDDRVLLLGTPTTINSQSYQIKLIERGIKKENIISQSCPLLETEIQRNPESENVNKMINEFLTEAKKKDLINTKGIDVVLCCTHYGYSEKIFHKEVKNIFNKSYALLNPNIKMVESIIDDLKVENSNDPEISVEVVSQVKLKTEEINSISRILESISPATAKALKNYKFNEFLFNFSKD